MIELRDVSRRQWAAGAGVVLVSVAGFWSLTGRDARAGRVSTLPAELSVEAIRSGQTDRRQLRDAMARDDFTEAQRRELRGNFRKIRKQQMQERVDEYFAASEDARRAVLDRHIEAMQEGMKEREARQREREASGEENAGQRDERRGRRPSTRAERKTRSESRSPDSRARQSAYRSALRDRMTERGIEMPSGGRRSRGGGRGR